MGDVLKILGQVVPAANSLTTVYTVPVATQATLSSIVICNQSTAASSFRLSVAIAGASDDPKQYLYYDLFLFGSDTFITTIGISLAATDQVRVQAASNNVSFNLFGVEL